MRFANASGGTVSIRFGLRWPQAWHQPRWCLRGFRTVNGLPRERPTTRRLVTIMGPGSFWEWEQNQHGALVPRTGRTLYLRHCSAHVSDAKQEAQVNNKPLTIAVASVTKRAIALLNILLAYLTITGQG